MTETHRILVCECVQEVSTFNPVPSGADDFDVRTGEEFFASQRGRESEVGGALEVFESTRRRDGRRGWAAGPIPRTAS